MTATPVNVTELVEGDLVDLSPLLAIYAPEDAARRAAADTEYAVVERVELEEGDRRPAVLYTDLANLAVPRSTVVGRAS